MWMANAMEWEILQCACFSHYSMGSSGVAQIYCDKYHKPWYNLFMQIGIRVDAQTKGGYK